MIQLSALQSHLLATSRIGHLATADSTGQPHVVPVCFAFNGESVYSVLDQKPKRTALVRLRRVQNIQANPKVALLLDHYEESWSRLWYLLITGEAAMLLQGEEQNSAVGLLREKYQQYGEMAIDRSPVIRITPIKVVSWGVK